MDVGLDPESPSLTLFHTQTSLQTLMAHRSHTSERNKTLRLHLLRFRSPPTIELQRLSQYLPVAAFSGGLWANAFYMSGQFGQSAHDNSISGRPRQGDLCLHSFLVCEARTMAAPTSQVVAHTQTVPRTMPHAFFLIHISYCCRPSSLLLTSLASYGNLNVEASPFPGVRPMLCHQEPRSMALPLTHSPG